MEIEKLDREDYFVPIDCIEETKKHIDKGGCCGQAVLSVIEKTSIKKVFVNWFKLGLVWKGHTPNKDLRKYLESRGYDVKLITKKNKTNFKERFYVIRIQWLGKEDNKEKPFHGYKHWIEATKHTHFILKEGGMFFCNESGWFFSLDNYLRKEGVVTSVFEIRKRDVK